MVTLASAGLLTRVNKLTDILIALAISILTGVIFFALAYLVIFNIAPPEDPAATGNLGLGQVLLAVLLTVIYIIWMTRFIYKRKGRKLMQGEGAYMYNVIKQQFFNFLVYTSVSLLFVVIRHGDGFTWNIYSEPVLIFSCVIFACSTLIILAGLRIYKKSGIIIYLLPDLIGFSILALITLGNKSNGFAIGYGVDELLWGFLVITTMLNIRAYSSSKRAQPTAE
jgi:magnesium-transporting ATPase (P-type)